MLTYCNLTINLKETSNIVDIQEFMWVLFGIMAVYINYPGRSNQAPNIKNGVCVSVCVCACVCVCVCV